MPVSEMRELALTRVWPAGSRGGTAAALVTPYALPATSTPRAAGYSTVEPVLIAPASTQQQNARIAIVEPIAQRRPCRKRSRKGPINGATTANGSMVRPRKVAT